jgi:hypothetical protein
VIDRVIATALREALQQLPPRAFGLRSHAIPTEDHLPECLAALMALLTEPLFAGLRVVVGSSRAGSVQSDDPRITVLPPDAAAAEATRLRNDSAVGATVGFRLVYLNTESSAGEAGLDGLSELRAPAVVRHFALNAGLPVLADLAQSKARPVLHRLEDSTVDQLAIYADAAVHQGSELAALPLLGFLPRDHSRTHPSAAWATDFDSLSGEKLVSRLRDALRTLDAVAPETRPSVGERFDSRVLPPKWRENPFPHVLAACRAVYRFASGHVDALPDLCGLTSGLLRMFRRGVDVIPAEPTDDTGSDSASPLDTEGPSTRRPRLEEDVLQQEGPLHLRCDLESLDPAGRFLTVTDDSGETSQLRSREGAALMALLVQRLPPRFWSAGGSVHVSAPEALLTPIVPSTLQIEEMYVLADARAGVGGNLGTRLEEFLAARNTFVDALAAQAPREDSHVPAHDEDVPAPEGTPPSERRVDAVLLLDAFPLTAVAIAQPQAAAYVAAYEGLVAEAADAAPRLPEAFAVWLTNVDVAFHADRSTGTVVAARLLPTHPLRLAHALEWLRRGVRPPAFPPAIAVHYRRKDWLAPHGREFSFHNNLQAVGPTTDGLREAAREGLRALWMLLGPRSLGRAIEVELVDVTNPVEVLEVLCEELLESFQEDASVSAVHLSVGFAFSDQARQPDAVVPGRDDLMPLSADLLDAPPGVGVSLALARSARHSGSVACHLAIQAVDTPYVRLPIEQADIDLPGTQITYVPGPAGNIAVVKLTGHSTMDAYRRLLEQFHLPSWLGFAPIQQSADVGSALVRTLVSRQGWPSRLPLDDSFLSYSSDGAHVVVTLCDPQVLTALLHPRLAELSDRLDLEAETHTVATSAMGSGAGAVREAPLSVGTVFAPAENTEPGQGYGVALNLPAIREGVRAMFACRAFISRVLANTDARHLLGDLGLLRAFGAAREEHHAGAVLVISLDSPEGRAWAARAAQLVDGTETRADLLVIEADSSVTELRGLRIAELKARTTASELGPAAVGRLAHQAQLTAARVRACWTDVDSERRRTRTEALRRLVWMGAGHQLQALRWQSVLQQLDQALLSPTAPPINAECWIVPEDEWPPTTFSKQLAVVDELGTPLVEHEEVRFRILGYQALKPPHSSEDLSGQAPIETPKSAAASARRPEASVSAYEIGASSSSGDAPAASPPEMRPRTSHQSAVKQPQEAVPARAPASVGGPYDVAITLGIDRNTGAPATWRPYEITPRLSNQHLLIVGKSGSGKSETTKALVWELQARQIPTIIFDFQGEYGDATKDFYRLVRPQVFDAMAGLPINPFEVPLDPRTGSRRPFIESVFRLADTLNRVFRGSGDIQLGLLRDAIRACYGKRGFVQDDPSSWNSEPPTVDMLNDELGLMVPQRGAQVKNLLVRLQPMFESGIFRPGRASFRLEDLYRRTSVILMTSGISDLMLAASRLMLEAIYSSMLASGESARIRLMACIDEAHKLCGDETITALIKEARKYGLGLILSSQETRDFHPSVFANVGTLVCLQLEEADAAVMAKQIASHDASRQRSLKQAIMSQTFPDGIVRSNHFQPYAAVRLTPFHERVTASDDGSSQDVSSLAEAPEGAPSAAVPVVPTPSPEAFLNFDLVRPLKSGGMAEVYEARDRATGELVCIKRVRATPSVDADAIQREAQIYQKLQLIDSPYLLAVRSFERDGGYWALVTDYAAGGDLASYVRTEAGGRLKPAQAKAIALQVTTGLRALHETNIVHRDLKPENVLLNGDRWQIADFGIAKNLTRLVTMRTFQSSGTLGYMAPEQMDGSEAHPSADIYSLAKILVFMLTGGTDKDYVTHPGWRSLVFGCLDASPDARPTADGVLEELSRIRV